MLLLGTLLRSVCIDLECWYTCRCASYENACRGVCSKCTCLLNNVDSVDSKRLRVTFDTNVLTIHTETLWICTRSRFESAHEDVLNLHTEKFWIYTRTRTLQHTYRTSITERWTDTDRRLSPHLHLSADTSLFLVARSLSLSLLVFLSFFSFDMFSVMIMSTRPFDSFCIHDPDLSWVSMCVNLGPFLVWWTSSNHGRMLSWDSCVTWDEMENLVSLGMKWIWIFTGKKNVLAEIDGTWCV